MSYVRIMADYMATGAWQKDGSVLELSELPIDQKLKQDLTRWVQTYDDFNADTDDKTWRSWAKRGNAIAKQIKEQLPDWTVIYFDEYAHQNAVNSPITCDRSYFEYEIFKSESN